MLRVLWPAALMASLLACTSNKPAEEAAPEAPAEVQKEAEAPRHVGLFGQLPERTDADNPPTQAQIDLGRMLYYDTRLSVAGDVSCNSCHDLQKWGVDNKRVSPGHEQQLGDRNSPTVYNAGLQKAQMWRGQFADLVEQAAGPIMNPVEMAMADEAAVLAAVKGVEGYGPLFAAAFPGEGDAITMPHIQQAIAAFEGGVTTSDAFDAYQGGDLDALTEQQKRGLDTFVEVGCATCHNGAGLGGQMFMKIGLVNAYETEDLGRYTVTENEADRYVFKVPQLRNVAKTGPYFHDGKVGTLSKAVKLMAYHQLGKDLTGEQTADIVAFLESLTGKPDAGYIEKPELPQ